MVGPTLVVLIMIARHLSAITMRMLLLLTGCGNYKAHLGPHSEIKGERQRQEERHREREVLLLLGLEFHMNVAIHCNHGHLM